jgi:hypothetical protein
MCGIGTGFPPPDVVLPTSAADNLEVLEVEYREMLAAQRKLFLIGRPRAFYLAYSPIHAPLSYTAVPVGPSPGADLDMLCPSEH